MTFRDVIGQDAGAVPFHEHDASDISGEAVFTDLTVDRLLSGTINSKEIIVAGGTAGILRSDNFVLGSAGWRILGDGSAEFNDVTVRGAIIAGSGSSIGFDDVTAATNTAALVIGGSGTLRSSNYSAGSAGWTIEGDGDAEFNDVTVRGDLISGTSPDQVIIQSGVFTATDGDHSIVINPGLYASTPAIFITPDGTTTTGAQVRATAISSPFTLELFAPDALNGVTIEDGVLGVAQGKFNEIALRSGGTGIDVVDPLHAENGTAGAPVYSFVNDTDTGLSRLNTSNPYNGGVGIVHAGTIVAGFEKNGNASKILLGETNDWIEYDTDLEEFHVVTGSTRRFTVSEDYFGAAAAYSETTGSAANLFVASGGKISRSTSSRRYKRAIRPYFRSNGTTVLNLEPSTFYSKTAADDHTRQYLGLIAEDVAENFPVAAVYDSEGRPDAIEWNAITAALLAEVKSLRARVDALEAAA